MGTPLIPQVTLQEYEKQPLRLIHSVVDHWAALRPGDAAILNATRGTRVTWDELRRGSLAVAAGLARLGFRKGDVLAAWLPLLDDHILLEYGCFRLGVIHAPLDLRLQPGELRRCVEAVRAKGLAFPGKMGAMDFAAAVPRECVEHLIQFSPAGECIPGARSFAELLGAGHARPLRVAENGDGRVDERDGAQVIFTTGSTGSPKPALLSHRGILCQNLCLARAFHFGPDQRVLCNLPASHVGGQAELLMTTLFSGAAAVTLETFDPVKSLDAIERYGVTLIGQIPAMFQLEWRTADYAARNFASLQLAVYGGQSAPRAFLEQMLRMAPKIATGLGLTETSGFCTYTALTPDAAEVAQSVGWAMPAYRATVRKPMEGGAAGVEVADGEIGHICFEGPQNFLGYLNDPAATADTLSSDGVLYTGDMGRVDERGLRLSGRAKWVLKPAGYQVFPGDVEAHFASLAQQVASVGVVGHPHAVWSEGIVAFVEKRAGAALTAAELRRHARRLTSYMRPLHYVILEPGGMPLNRTAKVDIARLQEMAREEVGKLRERGRWDA